MANDYWPLTPPEDWEDTGIPYWFQEMVWNIYSSLPGAADFGFTEQTFYNQFQNYFPEYSTDEADLLEEMMAAEIANMSDNIELWHINQAANIATDQEARQLQLDIASENMLLSIEDQSLKRKFSENDMVQQALKAMTDIALSASGGKISTGAIEDAKNTLLANLQSTIISGGKNELFDRQTALIQQAQDQRLFEMANDLTQMNFDADLSAKEVELANTIANEEYQLAYDQWNLFDQWEANLYDRIANLYQLGSENLNDETGLPDTNEGLVDGCTDSLACNYNPEANSDNGTCNYPDENGECPSYEEPATCESQGLEECGDGTCVEDLDDCGAPEVCEDEEALNYGMEQECEYAEDEDAEDEDDDIDDDIDDEDDDGEDEDDDTDDIYDDTVGCDPLTDPSCPGYDDNVMCTEPGACNEGGFGVCVFPEPGYDCGGALLHPGWTINDDLSCLDDPEAPDTCIYCTPPNIWHGHLCYTPEAFESQFGDDEGEIEGEVEGEVEGDEDIEIDLGDTCYTGGGYEVDCDDVECNEGPCTNSSLNNDNTEPDENENYNACLDGAYEIFPTGDVAFICNDIFDNQGSGGSSWGNSGNSTGDSGWNSSENWYNFFQDSINMGGGYDAGNGFIWDGGDWSPGGSGGDEDEWTPPDEEPFNPDCPDKLPWEECDEDPGTDPGNDADCVPGMPCWDPPPT